MDYSNAVEILPLYAVQQGNRVVALGILVLESYEMFELSTDEVIELLNEGVIHSGYIIYDENSEVPNFELFTKFYRYEKVGDLIYHYYALVLDIESEDMKLYNDTNITIGFATRNYLSEYSIPSLFVISLKFGDIANEAYSKVILNLEKTREGGYRVHIFRRSA